MWLKKVRNVQKTCGKAAEISNMIPPAMIFTPVLLLIEKVVL